MGQQAPPPTFVICSTETTRLRGACRLRSGRIAAATCSPVNMPRTPSGFTVVTDQQLGGLIMWIPGGMFFLIPLIGLLMTILRQEDARASGSPRTAVRQPTS